MAMIVLSYEKSTRNVWLFIKPVDKNWTILSLKFQMRLEHENSKIWDRFLHRSYN